MVDAVGPPLILASGSPFRRKMLQDAGLVFEVEPADVNERELERMIAASEVDGDDPKHIARELALSKARDVSGRRRGTMVIGCDQVLQVGRERLSKPATREHAKMHLEMLWGKTHALHSAVCIVCDDAIVWRHVSTARLTMRKFSSAFLDAYLDEMGGRVCQTVGGYEIEGRGIQLFERIEGDHFTIIGLPLLPLLDKLRELGMIAS
ncbi:MAG: Maf family protein [Hyphomicrobiaceae bacterium]|nr:Maf family protein [Hyphomicrobiaceae bacterium]